PAARAVQRAPARPSHSPMIAPRGAGNTKGARLVAVDRVDPVPAEYSLMKDEISIGRGEDNDVVIPHASVSRQHARLMRRAGGFELMDLNSTNGSYVDDRQIHGSAFVSAGSRLRLGDIRFVLQL
ncbi:MAG: FHA domain-containing protein, partial [Candidatus Binatus sp.]